MICMSVEDYIKLHRRWMELNNFQGLRSMLEMDREFGVTYAPSPCSKMNGQMCYSIINEKKYMIARLRYGF